MTTRGRELITADESTVMTKSLLDPIVVENGQSDRRLADSASTDESDWIKLLSQVDYLFDQLVASEKGLRWQRRGFSRCARFGCKMAGPSIA